MKGDDSAIDDKNPKEMITYAKALWDNDSEADDELSFYENDIVRVLAQDPSGWWKGEANGKTGYFPGNRVTLLR